MTEEEHGPEITRLRAELAELKRAAKRYLDATVYGQPPGRHGTWHARSKIEDVQQADRGLRNALGLKTW